MSSAVLASPGRLRQCLQALASSVFLFAAALHCAGQSDSRSVGGLGAHGQTSGRSLSEPQALNELRELAHYLETAVAEFYAAKMRYPESLQELGPSPALPPSVQSVRLGGTGASNIPAVIAFDLVSPDLGGHRVYFLLRADRGPSSWECVSTDIASIARMLPDCAYVPGYVPPEIQQPRLQPSWNALYEGTVGGSQVVALFWQVTQTTSSARDTAVPVEGLYYYRRHARTLALLRAPDLHELIECPESFSGEEACPRPTGIWHVEVTGDRVTGTWQASADAPPKVVKLERRPAGKSPARDEQDLYDDMQHEDQRRGVAQEARRHGIVWKTERRGFGANARTGRIVLLESPDAAARERINQRLKKSIRYPDSTADCARHAESCDDGNDVDVVFANERLFAVAGSSYWSGGAHPTSGFEAITFDLQSGEEIDWRRIVLLNDASAGAAHSLDLRRGDLLASYALRRAMQDQDGCMSTVAGHYRCAGDVCADGPDPEDGTWILYPTIDGLAVAPQVYSEAERGCRGENVIVPWPDVRKTLLRPMVLP